MKIYIAAPLFNEMERNRNVYFKNMLCNAGFQTYLPQEDGGLSYDLIKGKDTKKDIRRELFNKDVEAIRGSDVILCLMDGRVPDEGMCVELGIAYALSKVCLGFTTDARAMDKNGDNNIMLDGCLRSIYSSEAKLLKALEKLKI